MKKNTIIVKCDAKGCGWQQDEIADAAKKWHNAACPKCGHSPVMSDADLEILNGLITLRDLGLANIGKSGMEGKPHVDIHFDSSGLRASDGTSD